MQLLFLVLKNTASKLVAIRMRSVKLAVWLSACFAFGHTSHAEPPCESFFFPAELLEQMAKNAKEHEIRIYPPGNPIYRFTNSNPELLDSLRYLSEFPEGVDGYEYLTVTAHMDCASSELMKPYKNLSGSDLRTPYVSTTSSENWLERKLVQNKGKSVLRWEKGAVGIAEKIQSPTFENELTMLKHPHTYRPTSYAPIDESGKLGSWREIPQSAFANSGSVSPGSSPTFNPQRSGCTSSRFTNVAWRLMSGLGAWGMGLATTSLPVAVSGQLSQEVAKGLGASDERAVGFGAMMSAWSGSKVTILGALAANGSVAAQAWLSSLARISLWVAPALVYYHFANEAIDVSDMATSECNRGGELATALANVRRRGDPYYEAMLWGALKNLKDDREGLRKTHQRLWMFGL